MVFLDKSSCFGCFVQNVEGLCVLSVLGGRKGLVFCFGLCWSNLEGEDDPLGSV